MTPGDKVDQAVARRLAKLSSMPVDTSHLERAVRAQIGTGQGSAWRRVVRPLAGVAASLIVVAAVVIGLMQARPAVASAVEMAQMHRDIVSGQVPTMKAETLGEVNEAFAAFAAGVPKLDAAPEMHAMSCCMRNVGNKKVACVLLQEGGVPVTLAVADSGAVAAPASTPVMYKGEAFYVQAVGNLNMVMLDRHSHRICLIGELSPERLMGLTDGLKF